MRAAFLPLLAIPALLLGACADDDETATDPARQPASALTADDFERNLGCGFGFATASKDGTYLLILSHSNQRATPKDATLPDPRWRAEIEVGTNLTNNWCTDLITEPDAEIDETWQVVEGTLRFIGPPPQQQDYEPTEAEAKFTGVVVKTTDGERIELGDFELRNQAWGFLAG